MSGFFSHRRMLGLLLSAALLLGNGATARASTSSSTSSSSSSSSSSKILAACGGGRIPTGFSQQDYKSALKQMSPFLAEYTNCEELIHRAQLAALGPQRSSGGGLNGSGGSGSSASPTAAVAPPTPVEQRALEHAHRTGAVPIRVGDHVINPGVVHANVASAVSSLPTPLLVLVAFLLVCALLVFGWVIRRHVRTRNVG
jgi:hypothetical protein